LALDCRNTGARFPGLIDEKGREVVAWNFLEQFQLEAKRSFIGIQKLLATI
jgi:hypothetical protein